MYCKHIMVGAKRKPITSNIGTLININKYWKTVTQELRKIFLWEP